MKKQEKVKYLLLLFCAETVEKTRENCCLTP